MIDKKTSITPIKNGPLKITDLDSLINSKNEKLETKSPMFLCRCGESKNKPYCDGTHSKINFVDENEPGTQPDKRDTYIGDKITIHDNRGICSHAGFCSDNLPSVFKYQHEPWIDPNGASPNMIKKVINMCPSGALSYTENGKNFLDRDNSPEIKTAKNGPYNVIGGPTLVGTDLGDQSSQEHYTLCRCGKSINKPRCDGKHWDTNFTAE